MMVMIFLFNITIVIIVILISTLEFFYDDRKNYIKVIRIAISIKILTMVTRQTDRNREM